MIPTGPGRSRILWCMLMPNSSIPAPVKWMQALTPKWLQHLGLTPQVLDGDTGLLHGQVRTYFGVHTGLEWILLISLFRGCIAMTLQWGMCNACSLDLCMSSTELIGRMQNLWIWKEYFLCEMRAIDLRFLASDTETFDITFESSLFCVLQTGSGCG